MALGTLPVPGRPTIWMIVGQGPTALAVGAGGGCLDIFTLIYPFSSLSPSLWETARYRLKYCLKGPLNPKQPTNHRTTRPPPHDLTIASISVAEAYAVKQATTIKTEPADASTKELPALPKMPELPEELDISSNESNPCQSPSSKKSKHDSGEIGQSNESNPNASVLALEYVETDVKPSAMSSRFGDVYITSVEKPRSLQEQCELEVAEY